MSFSEKCQSILHSYQEIMEQLSSSGIEKDRERFIEISKKKASLDSIVDKIKEYASTEKDIRDAQALMEETKDKELMLLAKEELESKAKKIQKLESEIKLLLLPKDENHAKNVIFEIRAGTGGDEAALFVADLFRMYTRYTERKKWKMEILSTSEIGIGGFKEIIFSVNGENAYTYLKFEGGVHRVQRIPETETQGRIHTSAVTVAVFPEVNETEAIIDQKDIRIDVYRASGHGGQHVNKTESAVRITHLPTGIMVTCQDDKSQMKNREKAMKVLRARFYDFQELERQKSMAEVRNKMIKSGDRSEKIRTYNYPQSRITDHRINLTFYKLEMVMDGDLEELIDALIMDEKERLLAQVQF